MLEILFMMAMFYVFGKLFIFGLRAAWGLTKFIVTIVFLPIILIGMVLGGLIYLAFPILIAIGVISLFTSR